MPNGAYVKTFDLSIKRMGGGGGGWGGGGKNVDRVASLRNTCVYCKDLLQWSGTL